MTHDVLRSALAALDRGEGLVLVTVLETEGSSPASPGQKMIVRPARGRNDHEERTLGQQSGRGSRGESEEHGEPGGPGGHGRLGETEGTVGGGAVERLAIEEARGRFASGKSGIRAFDLDPDAEDGIGSLCGGRVMMAFEVFAPARRLLLFGAGHVALAFARLCAQLGWTLDVVDGRHEMLTSERFPSAAARVEEDPAVYAARAELTAYSHLVIFTHDHALDGAILHAIAGRGFDGYVGMIGSARKWAETRLRLEAEGIPRAWLDAVHCPIGLSIGSRTPEEIAVAIAAELIQEGHAR